MRDPTRRARLRHTVVGTLPAGARESLSRWVAPVGARFVVPLPDGDRLELGDAQGHRMLARLYWEGPRSYEPQTVRTWWVLATGAAHVVDVGAHVGYYALLASRAAPAALVQAVEPLPEALRVLERLRVTNHSTIRIHAAALGQQIGTARLALPMNPVNRLPTVGSIVLDRAGQLASRRAVRLLPVRVTTLDTLFDTAGVAPDLVKLDVEGAEMAVLQGGQRTIERGRPDVVMEVMVDGSEPPDAVLWLVERGYRVFDLTSEGPRPTDPGSLRRLRNVRSSSQHRYGEVLLSTKTDAEMAAVAAEVVRLGWPT